jgi:heptaprenyl diphosphate synthase
VQLPPPDAMDWRVARLAGLATAVHVFEAALPSPIPGVKPGLANVIVIAALLDYGYATALAVGLLRVVAAGLLGGGLFGPGFLLGLCGALASLAALGALWRLLPRGTLGPVGFSVAAAFAHIGAQFALARGVLVAHPALDALAPLLAAAALLTGTVNGVLAARLRAAQAA